MRADSARTRSKNLSARIHFFSNSTPGWGVDHLQLFSRSGAARVGPGPERPTVGCSRRRSAADIADGRPATRVGRTRVPAVSRPSAPADRLDRPPGVDRRSFWTRTGSFSNPTFARIGPHPTFFEPDLQPSRTTSDFFSNRTFARVGLRPTFFEPDPRPSRPPPPGFGGRPAAAPVHLDLIFCSTDPLTGSTPAPTPREWRPLRTPTTPPPGATPLRHKKPRHRARCRGRKGRAISTCGVFKQLGPSAASAQPLSGPLLAPAPDGVPDKYLRWPLRGRIDRAEREGFEPSKPVRVYTLSKRAP